MTFFSKEAHGVFHQFGYYELLFSLEKRHQDYLDRRVNFVEFGPRESLTTSKHTRANCAVVQQTALHRAERLLTSVDALLVNRNVYGIALVARAHFETSAVLGYFCDRLEGLKEHNIKI